MAQDLTPIGVRFWRHAVLIGALLCARPMQNTSWEYGAGMWAACLAITGIAAAVVAGLAFVFLTSRMKGRFWIVFVAVAWVATVVQIGAWWYARDIGVPEAQSRYFDPGN